MKVQRAAIMVACILAVVGCEQRSESLVVLSGSEFIKDTVAHYYASDEHIILVVWHGFSESMGTGGGYTASKGTSSSKDVDVHGAFWTASCKNIEYSCNSSDGRTGIVIMDGVGYDLDMGCIFLVEEHGGIHSVIQLDREFTIGDSVRDSLEALMDTDPQVAGFVRSFER